MKHWFRKCVFQLFSRKIAKAKSGQSYAFENFVNYLEKSKDNHGKVVGKMCTCEKIHGNAEFCAHKMLYCHTETIQS